MIAKFFFSCFVVLFVVVVVIVVSRVFMVRVCLCLHFFCVVCVYG